MNITFLGTAAANAYPEAFCSCRNCQEARRLGGPSLRKRSSALIDGELLIDLGPDIMCASQQHNLPLTGVRFCLQTHAHADHLDTSHLLSRSSGYGTQGAPRLHFFASHATLREAARLLERDFPQEGFFDPSVGERLNLEIHPVAALQTFTAGRYRVTALPANHDSSVESLLFAIQTDERSILYATDTASLLEKTWQAFHNFELCFDLAILDHTYGPEQTASDHLNAQEVIETAERMRQEGLLKPGGRVFATHIAHEGNPPHPELCTFAARHGYEVAYDGLTL